MRRSRRDGSPFMNLFMHAPLYDHFGKLRYFMGAQIDVSHVIENNPELESLQQVIAQVEGTDSARNTVDDSDSEKDTFQQLVETLDMEELRSVRVWEDRILQGSPKDDGTEKKARRPEIVRNHYSALLKNGLPTPVATGSSIGMYNNVSSHYLFNSGQAYIFSTCLCDPIPHSVFSSLLHP